MSITIDYACEDTIGDALALDGSFLVTSELKVVADAGRVWYEVFALDRPYRKEFILGDWPHRLDEPDEAVFIADLSGRPAGRVVVSEGWTRHAWIEDLTVDASCRRAGVGRALLDRAIAWAAERGLPGVRLETQSNNVPACHFYESCGFRLAGFDRELYRGLDPDTREVALFWYRPIDRETIRSDP